MWIVELALSRPYTFVVTSLLIAVSSLFFIFFTPKDTFPNIQTPIVTVVWSYPGLPAQEFSERITTYGEYALFNNVNGIERIESQTIDGIGLIRLHFDPKTDISTALSEATASSQSIVRQMPPGILPPVILRHSSSTVPIIKLILSGKQVTESDLYDFGNWRLRQYMASIRGATLLTPFGGKVRQVMVDVNSSAMQGRDLSARDINSALLKQVVMTPTGDARIGDLDYRVNLNNTPVEADALNAIPVANIDDKLIFLRDVAFAHDGVAPQTNVVRSNGIASVMMAILKNGNASTLAIIDQVKELLPTLRAAAPKGIDVDLAFDQSTFVKKAFEGVALDGILALLLTGAIVLIFLGSWRSTLIVLTSISLSIMTSVVILNLTGETLNIMTLGGLILAFAILVDDATVAIENIHRNMRMRKPIEQAILDGSYEVAGPAFISSLSICILFLPIFLLEGATKFLFTPFALAVIFAIIASYLLSRTVLPMMIKFILPSEIYLHEDGGARTTLDRYYQKFSRVFEKFRSSYGSMLQRALDNRGVVLVIFAILFSSNLLVIPFIGEDLFPQFDGGLLRLHVRAPSGTRIEVTEEIFSDVEEAIRQIVHPDNIQTLIDNIGLNPVPYTLAFGDNAAIGSFDGEILVSLKSTRKHSTQHYMALLREQLANRFPHLLFYFQPADIANQTLNGSLPSPIDIRVIGYDKENNLKIARQIVEEVSQVRGAVDTHLHQVEDFPELFIQMDRMELAYAGLTQADAAKDILLNFSTSTTMTPNFWLDRKTGVPYPIAVQNPKYRINTVEELLHIPISSPLTKRSQLLCDQCKIERRSTPGVVNHHNIQPVYDIYANVQDRDLGGVAADIQKNIDRHQKMMAPGNKIILNGVASQMREAFFKLGIGFILALLLVYCLMVIHFQSWIAPFVIITAIPGAITGFIWILFLTRTSFSIPSLMGAIMSIGIALANSILLITFANHQLRSGKKNTEAIHDAAMTRIRPILMTALAIIVGMIPMALTLLEGGGQNVPLGRAVIGGVVIATFTTLFFVPVIFSFFRHQENPYLHGKYSPYMPSDHLNPQNEVKKQ